MRRALCLLVFSGLVAGCADGPYEGYKYRSYSVKGQRYDPIPPQAAPGYVEEGISSHYHEGWFIFPGKTAIGEHLWPWTSVGAHKTLPLPCRVKVTNLDNGKSTVIRINDRGPFIDGRMLDVTEPVAKRLGFYNAGLAHVRIKVLSVGDGKYRLKKATMPLPWEAAPPPAMPVATPIPY